MADVMEQQRDDVAPVETPDAPSNVPADTWEETEKLLAEFDAANAKQSETGLSPDQVGQQEPVAPGSDESVDQRLADLLRDPADTKRISDLEGEIGSLRAAELERQSRADFEGFSKKLQAELGPNVDEILCPDESLGDGIRAS